MSRRIDNLLCAKGATAALIQTLFVTATAKWCPDFPDAIRPSLSVEATGATLTSVVLHALDSEASGLLRFRASISTVGLAGKSVLLPD
jgi:hypothetical protein